MVRLHQGRTGLLLRGRRVVVQGVRSVQVGLDVLQQGPQQWAGGQLFVGLVSRVEGTDDNAPLLACEAHRATGGQGKHVRPTVRRRC